MNRVAVQAGAAWLRVAADGHVLAALPREEIDGPAGDGDVDAVLAGLFDAPVDELLVVRPDAGYGGGAEPTCGRVVRGAPAALAALAGYAAETGVRLEDAGRDAVVVDAGHRGTTVTRVVAGTVVAVRHVPVGGARLDAVAAHALSSDGAQVTCVEARRAREALSLLPIAAVDAVGGADLPAALPAALAEALSPVVDAVRALAPPAGPGPPPTVLLVGGVARAPLLAELLDAARVGAVRVASRPDTAAVTGALELPAQRRPVLTENAAPPPVEDWLPPDPPPRRRWRAVLGALGTAAALAGLLVVGLALPPPALPSRGALVQYGYAVDLPAGWAHTGGLPERRRSLLTPLATPDGSDLISVERTPLGYDADAEPARARAELRARFAAAVDAGAPLSGLDDDARYAGRPVVTYRESGGSTDVDWYVVLDGDAQLSVGCRHTRSGSAGVRAACLTVVGSVRRAP